MKRNIEQTISDKADNEDSKIREYTIALPANGKLELVEREFFPMSAAGLNSSRANEQGHWWEDPSLSHRDNFVNLGDPIPGNEQVINTQLEVGANVHSTLMENEHGRKRQRIGKSEEENVKVQTYQFHYFL